MAVDGGTPPKFDVCTVIVTVLRNNYSPVFSSPSYLASVNGSLQYDQPLLTVTATDTDSIKQNGVSNLKYLFWFTSLFRTLKVIWQYIMASKISKTGRCLHDMIPVKTIKNILALMFRQRKEGSRIIANWSIITQLLNVACGKSCYFFLLYMRTI